MKTPRLVGAFLLVLWPTGFCAGTLAAGRRSLVLGAASPWCSAQLVEVTGGINEANVLSVQRRPWQLRRCRALRSEPVFGALCASRQAMAVLIRWRGFWREPWLMSKGPRFRFACRIMALCTVRRFRCAVSLERKPCQVASAGPGVLCGWCCRCWLGVARIARKVFPGRPWAVLIRCSTCALPRGR